MLLLLKHNIDENQNFIKYYARVIIGLGIYIESYSPLLEK